MLSSHRSPRCDQAAFAPPRDSDTNRACVNCPSTSTEPTDPWRFFTTSTSTRVFLVLIVAAIAAGPVALLLQMGRPEVAQVLSNTPEPTAAAAYRPASRLLDELPLLPAADAGAALALLRDRGLGGEGAGPGGALLRDLAAYYFGDTADGASTRRFEVAVADALALAAR